MIREHKFNSRWWGKPVGIVEDPAFFKLNNDKAASMLEPFDWVEYKSQFGTDLPLGQIRDAGFFQVDTQLPFSINLKQLRATESTEKLKVMLASESHFSVSGEQLAPFAHERFQFVPGCNESKINDRYALWTNELVNQTPETCLQVSLDGNIQGWFLAQPTPSGRLHLTLAMLARDAVISGMLLYHKAGLEYATLGYRLGEASFSVTNAAVHNMYAALSARFLSPIGQWIWISGANRE